MRTGVDGPEVGATLVAKRDAADADPVFGPLPLSPDVIQWHHDEIAELPTGATLLASNPFYANQAFRVGRHVYALQFHIETTPEQVRQWAADDPGGCRGGPARPRDDLPALRRRPRRRARRPGSPSPRGSPTSSAPARAGPPDAVTAEVEVPRRAVVRLARFGFEDGERAARLLSDPALGLWDLERNEPADPEAGPVVAALARTGDPDLAVRSLHRLVEALDSTDATGASAATMLAGLRGSALLRGRLLSVLGASSGLADHLAAHPGDWTVLNDDADGHPAGAAGPWRASSSATCSRRSAPIPTTRPGAFAWARGGPTRRPERIGALRQAYRRSILSLAGRDLGDGLPAEEAAAELADIAAAVLTAGLALAVAEQTSSAAPCRLSVIAMGKTGGRELNLFRGQLFAHLGAFFEHRILAISWLIISFSSSRLSWRTVTICTRPGVRICFWATRSCSLGERRLISASFYQRRFQFGMKIAWILPFVALT